MTAPKNTASWVSPCSTTCFNGSALSFTIPLHVQSRDIIIRDQLGWWYLRFRVIFSWQKLHRTMKNGMLPQVCVFEKLRLQPFAEKSSPPRICFARIACGLPPCRPPSTCAQMEWEWLLWTAHQWTLKKKKASDQLGNDMGNSFEEHSCFVKYDVYTYVYIYILYIIYIYIIVKLFKPYTFFRVQSELEVCAV